MPAPRFRGTDVKVDVESGVRVGVVEPSTAKTALGRIPYLFRREPPFVASSLSSAMIKSIRSSGGHRLNKSRASGSACTRVVITMSMAKAKDHRVMEVILSGGFIDVQPD